MPTYVYRRLGPDGRPDGTTFELFQRISDDPLTTDPETGQRVERVIGGGAGLIFKGTGFYETDYVRKPNGEKSEAKPEPKAETKTEAPSASNGKADKAD